MKFNQPAPNQLTADKKDWGGWASGKTEAHPQPTPWAVVNERMVGTNLVHGSRGAVDECRFPIFIGRNCGKIG
jgi:hypothetical protein